MNNKTLKPWGYEILIHHGFEYAVKKIKIDKGHKTSLHFHEIKHETIYILEGELHIVLDRFDSEAIIFKKNDWISIEPKRIHRMSSPNCDSYYLESQSNYLWDVVRIKDDYDRE